MRASRAGIGAAARAAGQRAAKVARTSEDGQLNSRRGQKRAPAPSTEEAESPSEGDEPWRSLLETKLPPPREEDNYELSDKGEDSEAEEPDRSHKHVPAWSKQYLQLLERQLQTDPDTIFGCRVPKVDLEVIFRDEDYRRVQKERPKRRRGSSGNWGQDRLSRAEVAEYKKKMGQFKRWEMGSGSAGPGA